MTITVIGAGAAGTALVQELSRLGGSATVIDQRAQPVELPPLSKNLGADVTPTVHHLDLPGITRLTTRVTRVRPGEIELAGGNRLSADTIVLATGLRPRVAPVPAYYLSGPESAAEARAAIAATLAKVPAGQAHTTARAGVTGPGSKGALAGHETSPGQGVSVGVLGSGFLALEIARGVAELGLPVDLYMAGQRPLPQVSGASAHALVALHKAAGVRFHRNSPNPDHRAHTVWFAAVGAVPDLPELDFGAEPDCGNNTITRSPTGRILVDKNLRAARGLYAIGDIAQVPAEPTYGTGLFTEALASAQGRWLAGELVGPGSKETGETLPTTAPPGYWNPPPWQWSFQGPVKFFAVGAALTECDPTPVITGDLTSGKGQALFFWPAQHPEAGRLARVESIGDPAGHNAAKKVLAKPSMAPTRAESDNLDMRQWARNNR